MDHYHKEVMSNEFTKYHLNLPFPAVLHHFNGPDKAGAHDHPFGFMSYVVKGWYVEREYNLDGTYIDTKRTEGTCHYVHAMCIHEIVEIADGDCWTIITPDSKCREPGFWRWENGSAYFRRWDSEEWVKVT